MGGIGVFAVPAECAVEAGCAPDTEGDWNCRRCGGDWTAASPSTCCGQRLVAFSPKGPAQCESCGLSLMPSSQERVSVFWPEGYASKDLPARWYEDILSGDLSDEAIREEVEMWANEGWQLAGISPRKIPSEDTRELVAQYLFSRH